MSATDTAPLLTPEADPVAAFARWYAEAIAAGAPAPDAMTLATATPDGRPSARMVLLKSVDARGFVFASNYDSRKGAELAGNPFAALVFYWDVLRRQVRVEGRVAPVDAAESDAIFRARPRESRLAAVASPQSAAIADRAALLARFRAVADAHPGDDVPRPAQWGGYRLAPDRIEFWQASAHRLHDRLLYTAGLDGGWTCVRLAP